MDKAVFIFCLHALGSLVNGEELHQFEYEYRVLEKLIELHDNQTALLDQIGQMDQRIRQLTRTCNLNALAGSVGESNGGGSMYVRWGRTTCPGNGTELVYAGFSAGAYYGHTGGAAEYLCLPTDPQWGFYQDATQTTRSLLYGGEYEMGDTGYFANEGSMLNQNAPCAICRSSRPTERMFPAKKDCPDGWSLEYTGYLCSGRYNYGAASQYVCLDGEPETVKGGSANENGKLFYLVEGRCGSLPCPPYVNGRELTCSVCTK